MKIRKGFVSNSSSSSFVVAFSHKPESVEELQGIMFGKQQWHYTGIYSKPQDTPTKPIVEAVFKEIKDKKNANKKEIQESIAGGYFDAYMEMFPGVYEGKSTSHLNSQNKEELKEMRKIWDEDEKEKERRADNIADAFMRVNNDKFIAVMEFCDNDGDFWSMMEHSGIFGRIEHIRTSYH